MNIKFIRNDISKMETDAIVLPANSELKVGDGSSKAIFEAAGRKKLEKACNIVTKKKGYIKAGRAVVTSGFNLPSKYIIHAVVPCWNGGNENEYEKLCSAYLSSLILADEIGCKSVAIPVLSSGHNRFKGDVALDIAIKSFEEFEPKYDLEEAVLTLYGHKITNMVKDRGYEVTELIDTDYVLNNDEHVKDAKEKALDKVVSLFDLYVVDGLKKALDYMEKPEVVDAVHKKAAEIVQEVLNKGVDVAVNMVLEQL